MRDASAIAAALALGLALVLPCTDAEEFDWAGRVGGAQRDVPYGIAVDSAGSLLVVGTFQDSADFDPGPATRILTSQGSYDAFAMKLDSRGGFVWARSLGSSGLEGARSVAIDGDGNAWIVGHFEGTVDFDPGPGVFPLTASARDAFIWKLSPAGDLVWAGRVGGASTDEAQVVALGGFGAVFVVGNFVQTADFDPGSGVVQMTSAGNEDVFVLKLDSDGRFIWARRIGGPSEDLPYGLVVAGSDRVWTVGMFRGTADFDPGSGTFELTASGLYDGFVSELDVAGDFVWAGRIGGAGTDRLEGIALDPAHPPGVYVVGMFQGTADLDPGEKTDERTSNGGYDIFVTALGEGGDVHWTRTLGGGQDDWAAAAASSRAGHAWVLGKFQGTADFDPAETTFALTASSYDAFAWKLDQDGDFRWAGQIGGAGDDGARAAAADGGGGLDLVGDFSWTADFDPGPEVVTLTPEGSYDAFAMRIAPCGAFDDRSRYGRLVFRPRCTASAVDLSGAPGTPSTYESESLLFHRRTGDRVFLSASGDDFASLVVDDALFLNDVDVDLGPYETQPGVPPFLHDVPIERNLVPEPPVSIDALVPVGSSQLDFDAVDLDRSVLGLTSVYVVVDCGLVVDGKAPTTLRFVCHDDAVLGMPVDFDVRGGVLSELRSDRGFPRSSCVARALSNPAYDPLPDPPVGDGRYYLARALAAANACNPLGYGDSEGLDPDPRRTLDALAACDDPASDSP